MSRPGYRSSIARPRPERDALTVDYADVLRQAVENERWRVLREVERTVEAIKTRKPDGRNSWSHEARTAEEFKKDLTAALETIHGNGSGRG